MKLKVKLRTKPDYLKILSMELELGMRPLSEFPGFEGTSAMVNLMQTAYDRLVDFACREDSHEPKD